MSCRQWIVAALLWFPMWLPAPLAAADLAGLRQAAEAAAGAPVRLDPRLSVPDCPGGFRFTAQARALRIECPANGFVTVAPVARGLGAPGSVGEPGLALVRRGELVTVLHEGAGFAVSVEAIAETSGAAGQRIMLRNRSSGARLAALVLADGRLLAQR